MIPLLVLGWLDWGYQLSPASKRYADPSLRGKDRWQLQTWQHARRLIMSGESPSFGGEWSQFIHLRALCTTTSLQRVNEAQFLWHGKPPSQTADGFELNVNVGDTRYYDDTGAYNESADGHLAILLSSLHIDCNHLTNEQLKNVEVPIMLLRQYPDFAERIGNVTLRYGANSLGYSQRLRALPWEWRTGQIARIFEQILCILLKFS